MCNKMYLHIRSSWKIVFRRKQNGLVVQQNQRIHCILPMNFANTNSKFH